MSYTFSVQDATVVFPDGNLSTLLADFADNVKAFQTFAKQHSTQTTEGLAIPLTTTLIINTQPEEGWEVVIVAFEGCFGPEEIILSKKYGDDTEACFVRYIENRFVQRIFTLQEQPGADGIHESCSPYEGDRLEVIRHNLS